MAYIIAALMAGLSFTINRLLMRYMGPVTVISLGPVAEEATKTLFAYYLGADIMTVHAVFGAIEALHDWYQAGDGQLAAPILSIAGHSLFGMVTVGMLFIFGSIWLGLVAGSVLHLAYNVFIVRLLSDKADANSGKRDNP